MTLELGRTTTLEGLRDILRDHRKLLGIPQHVVDDLSGLADGYVGKIEAGMKGLGKDSVPCLLGAFKLELAVMRAPSTHRGKTAYSEDFFSRRARKAAIARWKNTTPKQRKAAARAAAKVRWQRERERRDA